MSSSAVLDLADLRRSCNQCSLRQLCLPAGIGMNEVDRLDRLVRRRRQVARGEHLFRTGSALGNVYVARDGSFKTVVTSEEGEQQVIGFHLPGELIGLDALGDGQHRCDAVALESARVCEVPLSELQQVAAQIPGLQRQLLRVIGRSMGRDQDHLEMLSRRHATDRVMLFLHSLSERYTALGRDPDAFSLPMTREEIGSYLGLVIETVSRSFTKLQEDGTIAVRGRQVRLLQAAQLARRVHLDGTTG
ncbi:MAG: helix-turn-helix domain-containing protein [Chiayiivirga sp.]|jgi:CRP/FNR family transcriptional regulator|uniref:cyclic nucleotide-binding domain-containing protein n=1 Tax=Chiayiivirga sp. TaxID=2041042 RepID=UPI0025C49528|nr:cyclic nucleotide-binding domain-containing protein [Chiayiivirga sp.]MCI1710279.1 helix-turn-helix domain-containing protein [Chiayiivirga sp.]MCI1728932.1 helix-turn-helix domain-containing protein [Chiayiivirga sp.]